MMKMPKKLMMFAVSFSTVLCITSAINFKTAFAATLPEKVLIINERTGLQLHMDANNNIGSWNDPKNTANQWILRPIGNYYNIINVKSNLQLHLDSSNNFRAYNDEQNTSNMWDIVSVGNDYYVIKNVRTGLQLHLTSTNKIGAYNDDQNKSNHWKLEDNLDAEVKVHDIDTPAVQQKQEDNRGQNVIDYAKNFLGTPYAYGGTTPRGFDCSGFTQYVYNNFGQTIGRTTYNQVNSGQAVSRDNLKPGDLVFTDPGHVGMYVGDNQMIHAPYPGAKIRIEGIWKFYAGRRIMN
ncbi:NlpC/P60 family protein [Clostridium manihotivorum]|uniref:NlpC/P60 domain-containing protein n=1 Tax=Clostridium manihotivorum TaxID=2320868 RepID=A0A3R5U821_9CLOT|nr:NlpC/P60 family protein [Clostridium manihotivorum]QAA31360.1 hypothetical protein C1I91_06725 [Clostridium manihotivorum]